MAITWGSEVFGDGDSSHEGFKIGYETAKSGTRLTATFYVWTRYSVSDTNNTFIVKFNGTEMYNGKVSISTTSNSDGWADVNKKKIGKYSTTAGGTIKISASLKGLDAIGSSKTATVSGSINNYTSIGIGSTTITDNYNNSFTITATKGANGVNNTAEGPINLKYGYSSTTRSTTYTSGKTIKLPSNTATATANTITVYAESTTAAEFGNSQVATAQKAIRQYKAPGAPGTPTLTADSYKNGRLTVKQNWTYSWTAATPGTGSGTTNGTGANQTTSKVKGYRVQLYRKQPTETTFYTIPIKSGSTILSSSSSGEHFYDISTNSITINPIDCGIQAGDTVKLCIRPYTQFGIQNDGNKLIRSATTSSAESVVQNAGVMRVKVGNAWKEGVVWVKVNKNGIAQWVEADIVQVKTAAGWKEST